MDRTDTPGDAERPGPLATREYKTLAFKASSDGLSEGEFSGYAAAFSNVDGAGDIIERGAFAKTLSDFLKDGTVCWQHDWTEPIGKPLDVHEDEAGLYIKARISQTVQGKDALTLLRDDVIKKMSIGYSVEAYKVLSDDEGRALLGDAAYDEALRSLPWWMDGVRVLTQIKLYEVSLVTVPANANAVVTGVKGGSLAGLALDAHFQSVHAAERELITRFKDLADLRSKAGRVLSAANQAKLSAMRDSLSDHVKALDDMIAACTPVDDADEDGKAADEAERKADILREIARFQRTEAHLNGAI